METKKLIDTLRTMAQKSKVANDMFHDFATRERARAQITVDTMFYRMQQGGFKHDKQAYAEVLAAMADCGIGDLRLDSRKRVVALVNIKVKLQSVGQAAIGKGSLAPFYKRNSFTPLPMIKESPKAQVLKALSGVDNLVRSILSDTTIPAERRIEAARALLQETTQ